MGVGWGRAGKSLEMFLACLCCPSQNGIRVKGKITWGGGGEEGARQGLNPSLDGGSAVDLDFRKPFPTVPRDIVIRKLGEKCGLGRSHVW